MAIITTGQTFTATDIVTSTKLEAIASAAEFNDPADESSIELITLGVNAGKLGIKDAGITPAKLSTGHPSWDSNGTLNTTELSTSVVVAPESDDALTLKSDPESPDPSTGGSQISLHSQDSPVPSQVYVKSAFTYFQNMSDDIVASIAPTATPTADSDLLRKDTFTPSTYAGVESVTLPNGLIMKFGYKATVATNDTISFADDFPTACINVSATTAEANSTSRWPMKVSSLNIGSFNIKHGNSAVTNHGAYWQAIGY